MTDIADLYAQFPRLASASHKITSPAADDYNCVAWVERDLGHWWEPGFYWPPGAPLPSDDEDLDCYVDVFRRIGFELCASGDLEPGFLKIAIYSEGGTFHHVAKQLPSGRWSSKAGSLHDVRHDELAALEESGVLHDARATVFMRRPYDGSDPCHWKRQDSFEWTQSNGRLHTAPTPVHPPASRGEAQPGRRVDARRREGYRPERRV